MLTKPLSICLNVADAEGSAVGTGRQEEDRHACVPPSIEQCPASIRTVEGHAVTLAVRVGGSPRPVIRWYKDGKLIEADYSCDVNEDGSITFPSVEDRHKGRYHFVASNSGGSVEGDVSIEIGEETVLPAAIRVEEFGEYTAKHHAKGNVSFVLQFEVSVYMIYDYN